MSNPLRLIAMHGWAGDARCWEPWRTATEPLGWEWQTGEQGYGHLEPREPTSGGKAVLGTKLVVIGHSLGPHLVPARTMRTADVVVLLASFAAFVPPGRGGRRTRAALAGMSASLGNEAEAREMLKNFMRKVADPQSPELLPPGPADGPLDERNRARLRDDLERLGRCDGLPEDFPSGARVLIVEAEEDRIVEPEMRAALRAALPDADVISLPGIGHALLAGDVIDRVVRWVEVRRAPEK